MQKDLTNIPTSIEGKLRNIHLPQSRSLLPVYECVINSIHAIEDNKELSSIDEGVIKIYFQRELEQTSLISENGDFARITEIHIEDNGVGFDKVNYDSFLTSDSTHKLKRGSKGVGRFLWLKAFDSVQVHSTFKENLNVFCRNFVFSTQGIQPINYQEYEKEDNKSLKTKVILKSLRSPYRAKFPQSLDLIGRRILEYCLSYFLLGSVPQIILYDGEQSFCLNEYFEKNTEVFGDQKEFAIGEFDFQLRGLRFYRGENTDHTVFYCAHQREVLSESLASYIVDLEKRKKLTDDDERKFVYYACVYGKYLDNNVSVDRTKFMFDEVSKPLLKELGELSQQDIKLKVSDQVNEILEPYLEKIRSEKKSRIQEYITKSAPQYRPLLKYSSENLSEIPPQLSDDKLDLELHRVKYELEKNLKKEGQKIIEDQDKNFRNYPEYREKYSEFLEKYNDIGKSKLAEYVVHRKTMLDIFSQYLNRNQDGKYFLEEDIHKIIVPVRTTSDDINYQQQNLWIIDERLAYHQFLASDEPLNKIEDLSSNSKDRPDVLIFDNPIAFADGEYENYSSVVIIEFKRPMRNDYIDETKKNPITQVIDYIDNLKSGDMEDHQGRLIRVTNETPFYAYIICDLTAKLVKQAKIADFTPTPDRLGFFKFHKEYNSYIEIISFSKLIIDAKRRNQVLFEKLNL
jgi:hypothetical protein